MPPRVALINLGCPKNLVDSEVMLGHLCAQGYELTSEPEDADVVVVNTCGFLEAAAQESVDTLLSLGARKEGGRLRAVVAAGCMTQRYGADAAGALPEVDGFLGVGQAHLLPGVVERVLNGERVSLLRGPAAGFEGYGLRLPSLPGPTAYVKVSEGCDRRCSFCVIPQIRGDMVSRSVEEIADEAQALAERGTREVILIGQDPTRYGVDRGGHALVSLLERLSEIRDLRWIRLMYLFPDRHAEPVLEAVASLPRICRYVDMPLQHSSGEVLRRMNRPGDGQEYLRLLEKLRGVCPTASVRTTFMVGFPGETEAHFRELTGFVRAAGIDWAGVFRYSREEGSPAADLPGRVPARVARRRHDELMALLREVTRERLRQWIGQQVEVLVEEVHGQTGRGRTQGQAPEIDGETLLDLSALPEVVPGDFVLAEVTGSEDYDLRARAAATVLRAPARGPGLIRLPVLA